MIFPYNSQYTQSCRIHHVFWAWGACERNWYLEYKMALYYTARHGQTSRVFLDLAHFWPEIYLQMGNSFNISFNFMFFLSWIETIRVDPSRSELNRPGLAVRVDPVRLLYLPVLDRLSETDRRKRIRQYAFSLCPTMLSYGSLHCENSRKYFETMKSQSFV